MGTKGGRKPDWSSPLSRHISKYLLLKIRVVVVVVYKLLTTTN